MENITKLVNDIFAMSFDIVIPVSGNIVAVAAAIALFSIRYFTFQRNQKKYAGQPAQPRLVPRISPPGQTAGGYAPLEAAKHCDERIYRFFTNAAASRGSVSANGQMDQRFCAEMQLQIRGKAPPVGTEGAEP